ncbi:uncharacterized protein [Dermacentor albipictus]|uniref:uncharacterized protein isoform X1 n=1 Tax=Dermacentor albipictus TaxID=60249 RepID=UPI0031FCF458
MKSTMRLSFLLLAWLSALRMLYHRSLGVEASNCEVKEESLVQKLMELHNASVRLARNHSKQHQPVHFAEVCPGYCGENSVGTWCSPNCECRVLNVIKPPMYVCFEKGKPLPLGFK